MTRRFLLVLTLTSAVGFASSGPWADAADAPKRTPQAWTYDEAMGQLHLDPQDVYLQYVTLQLARNEGKTKQAHNELRSLNRRRRRGWDPNRRVDLFDMFTGALAVQEALQLDSMGVTPGEPAGRAADTGQGNVPIAGLTGPTIKSHPWGTMLVAQQISGRKPQVSPLAMCVPEDQYFVLFRSLSKLMEGVDTSDLWGAHLLKQATKSAKTQRSSQRLKRQLAMRTDPLTRPFYDLVVEEVAITGSDLYFREGSDVTMLFTIKQPAVFRARMDGFLAEALKSREDAVRTTGKIAGVDFVQVSTPDRAICALSAYPKPTLHVRSNSKAAMERVLRAISGKGKMVRLGESTEFRYIRTLMARGDKREDGLVYLSDPFIRRLVGPQLKLTERRRMLCYNHLRMIGHASMLYRTQFGRPPESLDQLSARGCAPGAFGTGKLRCPCGGDYELSADGTTGTCSHHGHAHQLVPCLEIPLKRVTADEAKQYKQFVDRYSRYWQRFFDPIAIRIRITPQQYRAETIVLPLIDNTIYSTLAATLGGEPEPLDALPVPPRNIFSLAMRLNKKALLKNEMLLRALVRELEQEKLPLPTDGVSVEQFLSQGLGNQVGMHVYDASPFVDFDLTGFMGMMIEEFGAGRGGLDDEMIPISFLVASLNAPVYLAVPVKDAEVVDKFLEQVDVLLAELARRPSEGGFIEVESDFYQVPLEGQDARVRCFALQVGPIKWRFFFARLGDGLYIASKRFILDDLAAAAKAKRTDPGPTAHAMARVRAQNWKQVLPAFQLGWAESSRTACLNNLGPLSSIARAVSASRQGPAKPGQLHREADRLHAVHFFCPDGGNYQVSPDGKQVTCTVHGTAAAPRQLPAPSPRSPMGRLIKDFGGATAELSFLEDGLHAIVTVDRK